MIDDKEVIEAIALECFRAGGQGKFAQKLGFSQAHMSGILRRKKSIPPSLLEFLGFEKRVVYVKRKKQ